jgi:hypothetical protein
MGINNCYELVTDSSAHVQEHICRGCGSVPAYINGRCPGSGRRQRAQIFRARAQQRRGWPDLAEPDPGGGVFDRITEKATATENQGKNSAAVEEAAGDKERSG